MVTVHVFYTKTGKPASSKRVSISFDGWFRGVSKSVYSDSQGLAHFDNEAGSGSIYVDGKTVHTGKIEGKTIVYTD